MRISEAMIRYYLDTVTVGYFDDHALPPHDVREYDDYIETMKRKAIKHRDMEAFRRALAHLLSDENIDLTIFNGARYPFDDVEMREIIRHAYKKLFPDDHRPEIAARDVELVQMPLEEWWRWRSG